MSDGIDREKLTEDLKAAARRAGAFPRGDVFLVVNPGIAGFLQDYRELAPIEPPAWRGGWHTPSMFGMRVIQSNALLCPDVADLPAPVDAPKPWQARLVERLELVPFAVWMLPVTLAALLCIARQAAQ